MGSRLRMGRSAALAIGSLILGGCGGTTAPRTQAAVVEPAPDDARGGSIDRPTEPLVPSGCSADGVAPLGDADRAIVEAVEGLLRTTDRAALSARVDWSYWARWERAGSLNDRGAPAPGPITSPRARPDVLRAILEVPPDCAPIWVAGELRIDLAPPLAGTPAPNAGEIEDVRRLAYEGQEVSAYCGPCPLFAVLFREEPGGGFTVLQALDLRGSPGASNR